MRAIVIVTTVGTEEQANLIARELVARRQAACVNAVHGVRSTYRWQGSICTDGEILLVVKTEEAELDAVAATLRELHAYDVPEILSFPVDRGDPDFLGWIAESVDKSADFDDDEADDDVATGFAPDND